MPKFRKKPLIIEAEQWFPGKKIDGVFPMQESPFFWRDGGVTHHPVKHYIKTLEGRMEVTEGDWIIKGVENELYPCKNSIFEKTYELVEE